MTGVETLNLRLYDIAKKKLKLSDSDARDFVLAIEEEVKQIANKPISEYKSILGEDMLRLEMRLTEKIHSSKTDMYKAMFLNSVVQLLAILGGVLAIVKFVS